MALFPSLESDGAKPYNETFYRNEQAAKVTQREGGGIVTLSNGRLAQGMPMHIDPKEEEFASQGRKQCHNVSLAVLSQVGAVGRV